MKTVFDTITELKRAVSDSPKLNETQLGLMGTYIDDGSLHGNVETNGHIHLWYRNESKLPHYSMDIKQEKDARDLRDYLTLLLGDTE